MKFQQSKMKARSLDFDQQIKCNSTTLNQVKCEEHDLKQIRTFQIHVKVNDLAQGVRDKEAQPKGEGSYTKNQFIKIVSILFSIFEPRGKQ